MVTNFKEVVDLSSSLVDVIGGLSVENAQSMVNLVETGGKLSELSQEARVGKRQVIYPGCVQKVRCKVKDMNFSNPFNKIVLFTPFEEFCVENELVTFESTEKLKTHKKFVDVGIYNPTSREISIAKGTVLGTLTDVAAAFPLPLVSKESTVGEINEIQVDGKSEMKFDLDHLSEGEKKEALEMLREESEVFSRSKDDIGFIEDFKLKIDLKDDIPVSEPYRKIPRLLYDEVKNHINNLLANGWIKQSFSPYASPMVCVRKKDGGLV